MEKKKERRREMERKKKKKKDGEKERKKKKIGRQLVSCCVRQTVSNVRTRIGITVVNLTYRT